MADIETNRAPALVSGKWMTITINYIFWRQLSLCEIAPIWRLQKYSTLNTYCGILSTCHNYKKIEFFVQVRSKITQSKQKFYNPLIGLQHIIKFSLQWLISFNQQMKKNGLLQNFFYDFLKIQVTNWVREIVTRHFRKSIVNDESDER
jgi:hypothetical protein